MALSCNPQPGAVWTSAARGSGPAAPWRRGGVVTQRTANPCTPVRFRPSPPLIGMLARRALAAATVEIDGADRAAHETGHEERAHGAAELPELRMRSRGDPPGSQKLRSGYLLNAPAHSGGQIRPAYHEAPKNDPLAARRGECGGRGSPDKDQEHDEVDREEAGERRQVGCPKLPAKLRLDAHPFGTTGMTGRFRRPHSAGRETSPGLIRMELAPPRTLRRRCRAGSRSRPPRLPPWRGGAGDRRRAA